MTTIITRLYADSKTAQTVASALVEAGHSPEDVDMISKGDAGSLAARLAAARVPQGSVAAYGAGIEGGATLVVVRAGFNPIGAARHAIRTCNKYPALNVGVADENVYLREYAGVSLEGKVQADHPYYMSNPHRPTSHGHILGSYAPKARRERTSAIRGGAYMSRFFWPMKLVSQKTATSAISGTFLFSSMFGLPTVIREWAPRTQVPTKV